MASGRNRKRENHTPAIASHPPTDGDERSAQDDYRRNQNPRDSQRKPIFFQNLRHFLEEIALLDLLDGSAPADVVRKHMGEDSSSEWDRETTEEEKEERNPLEVFKECPGECLESEPVFQESEPNRAGSEEYDGSSQPDLEAVHVEVVHGKLESENDVVDNADGD